MLSSSHHFIHEWSNTVRPSTETVATILHQFDQGKATDWQTAILNECSYTVQYRLKANLSIDNNDLELAIYQAKALIIQTLLLHHAPISIEKRQLVLDRNLTDHDPSITVDLLPKRLHAKLVAASSTQHDAICEWITGIQPSTVAVETILCQFDEETATELQIAILAKRTHTVKFLLEEKVRIDEHALKLAIYQGNSDIVGALLLHRAPISIKTLALALQNRVTEDDPSLSRDLSYELLNKKAALAQSIEQLHLKSPKANSTSQHL